MMILFLSVLFWFSIGLVAYSYIFYPVLLIVLARQWGKVPQKDESYRPVVGFLVPAYNEEAVIEKKIQNILALDYPPEKISVWVGSDCSSDKTEEIVKSIQDPRVHMFVAPKRGGKTGILNALAPLMEVDIILFTDANTMHRKDCLKAIVRNFADPSVGAVAGHIEHVVSGSDDEENAENFYRAFESKQKFHEGMLHSTISAFGGFYAVRKRLFSPIPHNAYSNDDVLIPMNVVRQKYRVIFEREAVSHEDNTENVSGEFSRRVRIGAGNFQAFFWLLDFLNPCKGWPWFCFVSHKVTRWFSPLFLIAAAASCAILFLNGQNILYQMIFTTGTIFVVSGLLFKIIPLRITRHIFYFLAMNIALFLGLLRFFKGIKSAAWIRTERST